MKSGQTGRARRTTAPRIAEPDGIARHSQISAGAVRAFDELVRISVRLNGPGGCAWDQAQTVDSLLPHLVEETWEAFDAARVSDPRALQEELGDVLYTVIFLCLLAERGAWFNLEDVLTQTRLKMQRRHPHVFGRLRAGTARQAYRRWQAVKRRERPGRSRSKRLRPLLVALWDALRADAAAEGTLRATVAALRRRATEGNAANARPARRPVRGSRRGRSLRGED